MRAPPNITSERRSSAPDVARAKAPTRPTAASARLALPFAPICFMDSPRKQIETKKSRWLSLPLLARRMPKTFTRIQSVQRVLRSEDAAIAAAPFRHFRRKSKWESDTNVDRRELDG